jgi:hypothetical protein
MLPQRFINKEVRVIITMQSKIIVLSTILSLTLMLITSMTLAGAMAKTTTTVKPTTHKPVVVKKIVQPVKHKVIKRSADYMRRYKAGWNLSCSDDMKETKLKATAPHSKAFLDGYRDSRTGDGPCPF